MHTTHIVIIAPNTTQNKVQINTPTPTSFRGAEDVGGGGGTLPLAVEGGDGQLVARIVAQPLHLLRGPGSVHQHHPGLLLCLPAALLHRAPVRGVPGQPPPAPGPGRTQPPDVNL